MCWKKSLKIRGTDLLVNLSKIKCIILSVLLQVGIVFNVQAADISAVDFNGNLLGKVIPDGSVVNFDNELIGRITADGFAINDDNVLIGGIVPQGIAISVKNQILGKVNNDGTVTSVNDEILGKALPNGLVVNDNYDVLGAVVAPGLVYDDRGKIVGRVSGDGNFYNLSGEKNGYVTASGYVFAPVGAEAQIALIGRLLSSKMVIDTSGKFLGSIAPDGRVVDLNKNVIGNIHANGFAYNPDGNILGHIVESGYAFSFDGTYLGTISYNGDVLDQEKVVGSAVFGNRVLGRDNSLIGFTVSQSATANTLDGKYLGRLVANGNIVKARDVIGKVGASGNIIDNKGTVIGVLNAVGPVFDYLGRARANAAVDGKVVSLDGGDLGYMQKQRAFDRNDKELGRILGNRVNFDNNNQFLGVSGITSLLNSKGNTYKISPYGYVFNEKGEIAGRNFAFSNIIDSSGKILTYVSGMGNSENQSWNEIAKLTGAGLFLDKNNELIGKVIAENYATDFYGNTLGYTNPSNLIVNSRNQIDAKILPDKKVVSLSENSEQPKGMAGNSALSISINGDYLGTSRLDGQIIKSGEIVGKISADRYVLDNLGALYGAALPFGVAVSSDCKFLGVVSDNGDIKNFSGAHVGTVLVNNQVVNETETVIGYVVYPQAATGDNGVVLGVESPLGAVLSYDNRNLGCQRIDGKIKNTQNEIVGRLITSASVMNYDNQIVGEINFSGKIMDSADRMVGYVGLDGGVHSTDGTDIGVVFEYKVAFDDNNTYLGRINSKGEVLSDRGEILGTVNYNGKVILKNGGTGFALYDLYVYDNEEKTVGYIAKNGTVYSVMGDVKGKIYQGFVLDKKQNLIGRGKRDYYIRDKNKNIVGYLNLNGDVINYKNITVGSLAENGDIVNADNSVIAVADPLQYYHKKDIEKTTEKTNLEPQIPAVEKTENSQETDLDVNSEPQEIRTDTNIPNNNIQEVNDVMAKHKIIGIAITPGGKYIGDVYSNNDVIDSSGNIVGNKNKDGQIVDDKGNIIGGFQEKANDRNKAADRNWWKNIMDGVTASPYNTNNEAVNVGPGGGIGPGGRYNPRRAEILAQLQNSRRQSMSGKSISNQYDSAAYTGWQDNWEGIPRSISSLRVDMRNMITADKPIPAVLARSLISLGNAPITAIVERNVYGEMGRNVIIPAGSRIIGGLNEGEGLDVESRFDGTSGGVKMKITWQRIIRPDGIAFILDTASQTGDAQGRGGGALGYVDEQMVKKYTVPLLGTLATPAVTYMMAADEDATGEVETSKQQAASDARQQFLEKMNEILDEIIESKSEIEPVTFVPAGTRIIIYPMVDLWLRSTKEIEKGETSTAGDRYKDILIDDTNQSTTVETNNNSNVNTPRNNQGQQNQPQTASLVGDGGAENQQRSTAPGAIPPPAADGTVAEFPDDEENETGDIELF